jgi:antitoxin component HigA of HigAB toxin-antitoxin module
VTVERAMNILMPVETEQQYEEALQRIQSFEGDLPDPESEQGRELAALMKLVDEYEKEHHGSIDAPSPATVVQQRMRRLNLTQAELAEKTGIPESRISEIVNDKRLPSRRQIEKLSAFFDIPADLLVRDRQSPAAE